MAGCSWWRWWLLLRVPCMHAKLYTMSSPLSQAVAVAGRAMHNPEEEMGRLGFGQVVLMDSFSVKQSGESPQESLPTVVTKTVVWLVGLPGRKPT